MFLNNIEDHTLIIRTFCNGTPESGLIKSAKNCSETSAMALNNWFVFQYCLKVRLSHIEPRWFEAVQNVNVYVW